jgi:hypothetical protein
MGKGGQIIELTVQGLHVNIQKIGIVGSTFKIRQ